MRRAGIVGTPRQGIKNTPSRQPEMAEREHGGDGWGGSVCSRSPRPSHARVWGESMEGADPDGLLQSGVIVEAGGEGQKIVLLASVPLSSEAWQPLAEGEVIVVRDGQIVASRG